ncbi:SDR family NAD(P)-dependent oxidoreductase [Brachybacterium sp. EF45031]|uniref:SDR family NAD(P)-dependent oxidoreductase n=1 Tax=Brachybacterium sillae TaxID=2810536 RepID=UPI00217D6E38|nr:SDR family NAD(P)-dependent oxidoreductase [Brachybacterium sillae]MCS6711148.1 SDR family NAD(P)-dependent oxidoreductase [Brachybacterium sillae]
MRPLTRTDRKPLALVLGASRGLGLRVAAELLERDHRVVLSARHQDTLEEAARQLVAEGADAADVHTQPIDATDADAVMRGIAAIESAHGPIDVAIHVAGIIEVGPAESTQLDHLRRALDVMAWGPIHLADALIPRMRERGRGRFGVVTSIGGLLSPPHLLAYSTAKFAAVGFTEGLAASLAGSGVTATVIVPGLMRTGSHRAARFYGDRRAEYSWFAPAASLPLLTASAEHAARRMVSGVLAGRPYVMITPAAEIGARVHGLAPGLTTRMMGVVGRVLPGPVPGEHEPRPGEEIAPTAPRLVRVLTTLGERAARRNREPGLVSRRS